RPAAPGAAWRIAAVACSRPVRGSRRGDQQPLAAGGGAGACRSAGGHAWVSVRSSKLARPAFMIHNEKDHAEAWSFRFGRPMVTVSSRGASSVPGARTGDQGNVFGSPGGIACQDRSCRGLKLNKAYAPPGERCLRILLITAPLAQLMPNA